MTWGETPEETVKSLLAVAQTTIGMLKEAGEPLELIRASRLYPTFHAQTPATRLPNRQLTSYAPDKYHQHQTWFQ